jgi:hypothetical protein
MQEDLIDAPEIRTSRKRPVFLTVLCILTWIGSGLGLIVFPFLINKYLKLLDQTHYLPSEELIKYYKWYLWSEIAGLFGCTICIFAALMMWKLRRWGFYLYVTGQIIPMVVIFIAQVQGQSLTGETLGFAFMKMLFPIGFIVMYALNLKYMRRANTNNL